MGGCASRVANPIAGCTTGRGLQQDAMVGTVPLCLKNQMPASSSQPEERRATERTNLVVQLDERSSKRTRVLIILYSYCILLLLLLTSAPSAVPQGLCASSTFLYSCPPSIHAACRDRSSKYYQADLHSLYSSLTKSINPLQIPSRWVS
jgi:hypothetical protein